MMAKSQPSAQAAAAAYRDGCARVARLLTATGNATQEDADFFLSMLREAFVAQPSMVSYEITDGGMLLVRQVENDNVVHWREGQKSVIQFIEHAIKVGRGL